MTAEQAIYQFWAGFGIPAYEENSVPSGDLAPDFPYIAYSVSLAGFGENTALSGSIYTRSTSWEQANAFSQNAFDRIGYGGEILRYDGGAIWLKRGTPFSQSMGDDTDALIKRINLNLFAETISAR